MKRYFSLHILIILLLCSSCSINYLVLSEEGTGQYTTNGTTNTFLVPKGKGLKVRKKSKKCFKMYWGGEYLGLLCNPSISFFGKNIPDGITEIDIDDFIRMKKEGRGSDDNTTESTPNSSSDRSYLTGTRGGTYYINSKGNKTYKKRTSTGRSSGIRRSSGRRR